MLGVEAKDMSAQFFIEYNGKGGGLKTLRSDQKGGGQYLRFRKGKRQCSSLYSITYYARQGLNKYLTASHHFSKQALSAYLPPFLRSLTQPLW